MLCFRNLLELEKLDPAEVLLVRHTPVEKDLKRAFPWLVVERPDLFLAYQQIQWPQAEKAMTKASYVVGFVGQEPRTATFGGLYRINGWRTLDEAGYNAFPGNAELKTFGMAGRAAGSGDCLAFDLERLPYFEDWVGRLVISWPAPYQLWCRWAERGQFPVLSIDQESRFIRQMPSWEALVLTWTELQNLPSTWRTTLAQWRGVYFIFDTVAGRGYVGSAYGEENILGRWLAYARTGHGGNKGLRASQPGDLRFSILQRTSPDMDPADIVALESTWKDRLHTRAHGLNHN